MRTALSFVLVFAGCTGAMPAPTAPADGGSADGGPRDLRTGECRSHLECDDGIPCTRDSCRITPCSGGDCIGFCDHTPEPFPCADGHTCDVCGGCVRGRACAAENDCDDEDPCTTTVRCDGARRVCVYDVLDGDDDGE